MNFYNEHDAHAAAWLRELIREGHIPAGVVDERDIQQLTEVDLAGFAQVHLFAGIAGWPLALRLAGWPDDQPVWTGSCPCQPFSSAGKRKGAGDARHLWPDMRRLVAQCWPVVIFGEQVESAIRLGWLDGISADLEAEGYAIGSAVLGAHSVGSPHIRQRLYWVADSQYRRSTLEESRAQFRAQGGGVVRGMGDADRIGHAQSWVGATPSDAIRAAAGEAAGAAGNPGFWSTFDLIPCRDGKARRVEPGTFPLAHGVPGRVGLLRGYGNAICPQAAAAFITAYLEARGGVAA